MPIGVTMLFSPDPYYTQPFSRGGQAASVSAEVLNLGGSATLDVTLEHKNSVDTAWTSAGSLATFSGTGYANLLVTGLKEQLRFKYEVGGASAGDFVQVYTYPLAWKP